VMVSPRLPCSLSVHFAVDNHSLGRNKFTS
jgi:hypothetical protein